MLMKTAVNDMEDAAAPHSAGSDYALVALAIEYLHAHFREQPSLEQVAAHLHMSPFHLQRLFKRWAGISPKRFVQYLTLEYAKGALLSAPVLEASLESGLSGPGRLHDLFVSAEAVTPGEYRSGGAGLTIHYGAHDSPFGNALLAVTDRGVCALSFVDDDAADAVEELHRHWPAAHLLEEPTVTAPMAARIFETLPTAGDPIPLLLKGTNYQIRVWEALLRVPPGAVTTYANVATAIGAPTAARAVGSAVGANTIAWLIPCHRIIHKSGVVEGYRWGSTRKRAMLGWEAAHRDAARAA